MKVFHKLCGVIFLVKLQGKFEIDHSWSERVTLSCPRSQSWRD